ncbi:hypothetical protein [Sphingobium yanoikuyae]|uniref:hypothetical protein n=1 Tax=Sphingobium yanoikuyae TaxID=13690 RepID=UPI002FDCF6C5
MAVSTTDTYSGPYTANGVTVAFPFTFKAVSVDDVGVSIKNADGSTTLVNPGAYTVALAAEGGTVTMSSAPAAGDLYIFSEPSFLQPVAFESGQPFLPSVVNEVNDRDVVRQLYLKREVERSPKAPIGGGVEGQFPVVMPDGSWGFGSGTGNDPALRADLGSTQGPAYIGLSEGGSLADLLKSFVVPDQFRYADDTDKVQAALDTGKTVVLPGTYETTGNVQHVDGQAVILMGTVRKKPGTVNTLWEVSGAGCRMLGDGQFQDFNRTAMASVSAGGTTITLSNLSGGKIHYYTQDGYLKGTPLYGVGFLPGTRIVGGPTASGGGAGTYTIDRPAPGDWSGAVMFIDAETFWWGNRSLYISGADFEGTARIFGSAGDALTIAGRNAKVDRPRGRWLHDNGLLVIGPTSGGFVIDSPDFRGSGWQNTLFVTAGDQVPGGTEYVHGGVIHNPTGLYAGDTALELGYHSKAIEITGVARLDSHFPPILLRDTLECRVASAMIYDFMPKHPSWSHIAVVPSTEGAQWQSKAVIQRVRSFGPPGPRAFAYIGQSGVDLIECFQETTGGTNAVAIGTYVSDVRIARNTLRGYESAVHGNWGATIGNEIARLNIEDNDFHGCSRVLQAPWVNFHDSRSVGNKLTSTSNVEAYNLQFSSYKPSGTPPMINLTLADDINIQAVSGAGTPAPLYQPTDALVLGIAPDLRSSVVVLPEVATDNVALTDLGNVRGQLLRLWTDDGTEQAIFWIDGVANSTSKIAGTANLVDQSGFSGSTGWALGYFFGQLVIRRCGASTGVTDPRHLMWTIL